MLSTKQKKVLMDLQNRIDNDICFINLLLVIVE